MIKTFAIVTSGFVSNTIDIDDADSNSIAAFSAIAIPPGQAVSIGFTYSAGVFAAPVIVLTLAQAKEAKKSAIRAAFEAASNANIPVAGVVYQGGYEKAMRLDAAKRLAELAGQTSTVFYDITNVGRTLTIAQATVIVLAISAAYQTGFARKQARMVAIDAATTMADISAIVY